MKPGILVTYQRSSIGEESSSPDEDVLIEEIRRDYKGRHNAQPRGRTMRHKGHNLGSRPLAILNRITRQNKQHEGKLQARINHH